MKIEESYYSCVYPNLIKYNNSGCVEAMMTTNEEIVMCDNCGNPLESCMCVCPYCGTKDACDCCLLDAATGGG